MRLRLGLRERKNAFASRRRLARQSQAERVVNTTGGGRLNLGCGEKWRDGWVNVDLRADVADVICTVEALPFPNGSVIEILAEDILEHVWRDETEMLLAEWRRVLTTDGLLRVKVPNRTHLAHSIIAHDKANPDLYICNIYGGHRWGPDGAWDTHHWGWTPHTLERDLRLAGSQVLSNDLAENMSVVASLG